MKFKIVLILFTNIALLSSCNKASIKKDEKIDCELLGDYLKEKKLKYFLDNYKGICDTKNPFFIDDPPSVLSSIEFNCSCNSKSIIILDLSISTKNKKKKTNNGEWRLEDFLDEKIFDVRFNR